MGKGQSGSLPPKKAKKEPKKEETKQDHTLTLSADAKKNTFAKRFNSLDMEHRSNKSLRSLKDVLDLNNQSNQTGRFEPLQSGDGEKIGTLAAVGNSYQS